METSASAWAKEQRQRERIAVREALMRHGYRIKSISTKGGWLKVSIKAKSDLTKWQAKHDATRIIQTATGRFGPHDGHVVVNVLGN